MCVFWTHARAKLSPALPPPSPYGISPSFACCEPCGRHSHVERRSPTSVPCLPPRYVWPLRCAAQFGVVVKDGATGVDGSPEHVRWVALVAHVAQQASRRQVAVGENRTLHCVTPASCSSHGAGAHPAPAGVTFEVPARLWGTSGRPACAGWHPPRRPTARGGWPFRPEGQHRQVAMGRGQTAHGVGLQA